MIKSLFLITVCLLYSGCNQVRLNAIQENEVLSCDEISKVKSLESLEQHYRCNFK